MISYVLRSKINQHASQTSWRYNSTFTTAEKFFFFFSLPEQRKIDRGGGILCTVSREGLKGMTVGCIVALLMVQLLSNAITAATTTSGTTSQRIEALKYPFPRVMPEAINTEGVGS